MTLYEFEHKLCVNGWKHRCWEDVWVKDSMEICFPEHNPFEKNADKKDINEIKVKYKDSNGKETIVESEEEILKLIN